MYASPRSENEHTNRMRSGDVDADRLARRYGDALRVGDIAAAHAVIRSALDSGMSAAAVAARVLQPAMYRIGELWAKNAISVADEHLATAITHQVLAALYHQGLHRPPASRERVVLACVPGDTHALGLRMIADVLEGEGYDVLYLGADVPADALAAAVARHRPVVVGLSMTMPTSTEAVAELVDDVLAAAPHATVFVGGQARDTAARAHPEVVLVADAEQVRLAVQDAVARSGPGPDLPPILPPETPDLRLPQIAGGVEEALSEAARAASDLARDHARRAYAFEQLAFRDVLTGLANRRAFDDRVLMLSDDEPASLLLLDVDRFKDVNDGLGHEEGDRVLQRIANAIERVIRPGDLACRWGGDEFAVLLPGARPPQAERVAQRIRDAIAASGSTPAITVSIGVAPVSREGSREGLLAADVALYEAKRSGRDRVAVGR